MEILIAISLFSIIVLFLYQTLDMTNKTNNFYSKKLDEKKEQNYIKQILFLDLLNKTDATSTIKKDRNGNSIFAFKSENTYHNPFYENITYFVTRENNLIRIESLIAFNKDKIDDNFLDNAYIDILYKDIEKFKLVDNKKKIAFYIQKKNKEKILFSF